MWSFTTMLKPVQYGGLNTLLLLCMWCRLVIFCLGGVFDFVIHHMCSSITACFEWFDWFVTLSLFWGTCIVQHLPFVNHSDRVSAAWQFPQVNLLASRLICLICTNFIRQSVKWFFAVFGRCRISFLHRIFSCLRNLLEFRVPRMRDLLAPALSRFRVGGDPILSSTLRASHVAHFMIKCCMNIGHFIGFYRRPRFALVRRIRKTQRSKCRKGRSRYMRMGKRCSLSSGVDFLFANNHNDVNSSLLCPIMLFTVNWFATCMAPIQHVCYELYHNVEYCRRMTFYNVGSKRRARADPFQFLGSKSVMVLRCCFKASLDG